MVEGAKALLRRFRDRLRDGKGSGPTGGEDPSGLAEKNQRLRQQVKNKNRKLAELRERLERIEGADRPPGSRDGVPIFFIVGQAKSGTSWLMRTLNHHPEILCRGEGRFFGRDFRNEDFLRADLKTIQPSSLYSAIIDSDYLRAWVERSVWTREGDADGHLTDLTRLAVEHFLSGQLSKAGKRIAGDKTPFLSSETISEISAVCPEAKVIHIVRDGRDVAVSLTHHRWNHARDEGGTFGLGTEERAKRDAYREDPRRLLEAEGGIFTEAGLMGAAKSWREHVGRAVEDGPRLLGDNYAEVRYEDLLERPEEEIERVLRFLGADAGEEAVKRSLEAGSFERWTKGRERGEEESTSFFRKGVAGDWRGVFNERDKQIFKEVTGDLLIELGYEGDDSW